MSEELKNCPACGCRATVGWGTCAFLGMKGWTADCKDCIHGPRVTRFTRERAIESWNSLVDAAISAAKENT